MDFQIVSDLHLDFLTDEEASFSRLIEPSAPVLLIAGDTSPIFTTTTFKTRKFFLDAQDAFERIIRVPGNHDFFGLDSETNDSLWFGYFKVMSQNSMFGNRIIERIEDVTIIGCTLWSNVPKKYVYEIEGFMPDYKDIVNCDVKMTNKLHFADLTFIENALKDPKNEKCLILTHHLPTWNCVSDRYKSSIFTYAFANKLDDLIQEYSEKIVLWAHGHSHDFLQTYVEDVPIVRNPYGYIFDDNVENSSYKKDFVVSV